MTTPETPQGFSDDPRLKTAFEFCCQIQRALKEAAEAYGSQEISEDTAARVKALAESIIHMSAYGGLPFRLHISVPGDVPAHISKDWEILDEDPREFEASEVRALDARGVEFHDIESDNWLIVFGHNVKVTPVMPDVPGLSEPE